MLCALALQSCAPLPSVSDQVERKMDGVSKRNAQGELVVTEKPKPAYGALLPIAYLVDSLTVPIFIVQMIFAAMRGYRG